MKNKLKKVMLCIISAVVMLTGCKNNSDTELSENIIADPVSYTAKEIISDGFFNGSGIIKNGNLFYIGCDIQENGSQNYALISADRDGNEIFSLPLGYIDVNSNINFDTEGNVVCIVSPSIGKYKIITVDNSGQVISESSLDNVFSKDEFINDWLIDNEGNIIFNLGNSLKITDKNWELISEIKTENDQEFYSLIITGDGIPAAYSVSTNKLYEIDIKNNNLNKEYLISDVRDKPFSGYGKYLCLYSTDTGIYGIKKDDLQSEQLLDFLQTGMVNPETFGIYPDINGEIVITSASKSGGWIYYILSPSENDPKKGKKSITIGGYFYIDNVIEKAAEFNRTNDKYYIEFKKYGEIYDGEYSEVLSQLDKDILAGNVPDILIVEQDMQFNKYADKGLFADIYELIDNDDEISRDDFLPNILSALENDGKLFGISTDFKFEAYIGKKSVLGDSGAISIEKANDLLEKLNDGARLTERPMTCDEFILNAAQYGNFIDYKNKKCSFDSPEFISILEAAAEYPKENDLTQYDLSTSTLNGDSLFTERDISSFYNYVASYAGEKALLGEDINFMGFPTTENGSGAKLVFNRKFAISEQSEVKNAAWEFIKSLIKDSVTYEETEITDNLNQPAAKEMRWVCHTDGFPILKEQLLHLGEQSMEPEKTVNENGEIIPKEMLISSGKNTAKIEPLTQQEVTDMTELIMSLNSVKTSDKSVENIISEECSYYFGGARSAEETAELIQSRISIYLSEQY